MRRSFRQASIFLARHIGAMNLMVLSNPFHCLGSSTGTRLQRGGCARTAQDQDPCVWRGAHGSLLQTFFLAVDNVAASRHVFPPCFHDNPLVLQSQDTDLSSSCFLPTCGACWDLRGREFGRMCGDVDLCPARHPWLLSLLPPDAGRAFTPCLYSDKFAATVSPHAV